MLLVLLCLCFTGVYGFLLEPQNQNTGGQTSTNGQYLTVSEFYDQMNLQHQDTERLRHYVDKSLETLTLQIQQKFVNFENQKSTNSNCNCSDLSVQELQQKYKSLEDKNVKLQTKFDELMKYFQTLEQNKNNLETRVAELEKNRQLDISSLNKTTEQTLLMEKQILLVENKTTGIIHDISELKKLSNIKPLLDIQSLESKVQSISSLTHALRVHDEARNQDFLALYNITLGLKQETERLKTNQSRIVINMDNRVHSIDNVLNSSLVQLQHALSNSVVSLNSSIESVNQRVNTNNEQVAVTASVSTGKTYTTGTVIPFGKVVTQTGIHDVSAFIKSGIFICDKPGIYQVSVTIFTAYDGEAYSIFRNDDSLLTGYPSSYSKSYAESGSAVAALQLQMNDTISIRAKNNLHVYDKWSFIAIVKIK